MFDERARKLKNWILNFYLIFRSFVEHQNLFVGITNEKRKNKIDAGVEKRYYCIKNCLLHKSIPGNVKLWLHVNFNQKIATINKSKC